MPENKDNIIKFAPKAEKELDPKKQLQKELLERLAEGSRNLRKNARYEHILYYVSIFGGIVVLLGWSILSMGY